MGGLAFITMQQGARFRAAGAEHFVRGAVEEKTRLDGSPIRQGLDPEHREA